MKGRASRAVYMRLQPSLLSPPSDPEEREKKKREQKKKKREQKKTAPFNFGGLYTWDPTTWLYSGGHVWPEAATPHHFQDFQAGILSF